MMDPKTFLYWCIVTSESTLIKYVVVLFDRGITTSLFWFIDVVSDHLIEDFDALWIRCHIVFLTYLVDLG